MRNKHWTDEDIAFLKANYKKIKVEKIGKIIDKSESAIRWKASQLGLTDKPDYWRIEEIKYIAENYSSLTIEEMALYLKRTAKSVIAKIYDLRVTKTLHYDVDTSNIEDKVPFYKGKSGEYRELLKAMQPGQSFEYPKEERQTLQNQIRAFPDRYYRTREIDANIRRVWRLL